MAGKGERKGVRPEERERGGGKEEKQAGSERRKERWREGVSVKAGGGVVVPGYLFASR